MKTVAVIQARMGSTRLPGKVMMDLGGMPVLAWVIRAAKAAAGIDDVWVATSMAKADEKIPLCWHGVPVAWYRGSETDVLSRFVEIANLTSADVIVRLTGDCPLLDPAVIDQVIALRSLQGLDYASNIEPPTWPDGLDCEAITAEALMAAHDEVQTKSDREHVTTFIRRNRHRFPSQTLVCPIPGLSKERWTLDTPEDLAFLRSVAPDLPKGRPPSYTEVLRALYVEAKPAAERAPYTQARAESVIPNGAQTFSKRASAYPPGSPVFLSHGYGGRVWDIEGKEYVDLVSALLPNVLGYCDPDVDYAIRQQLTRGISFSLATTLETDLAERLVRHIPCAEMVRFGKNGTDATSAAIRLARAYTKRDHVILTGYHGWQDWSIGTTSRCLGVPDAVSSLSHALPFGDLEAMRRHLETYDVAAIIVEPANAATPPDGYLRGLRDLATEHSAVLVFDEVITGFRWSLNGAQTLYGVTPDLACFGKAMGNGMPISAVVGASRIMRLMQDVFFSGTFGGEALSLAASIATIDKLEREKIPEKLWEMGGKLADEATKLIACYGISYVISLRGEAPWKVLSFSAGPGASKEAIKTVFLREMIARGVLINASHNVCYAHTDADVAHVLSAYDHAIGVLAEEIETGDLDARLGNQIIKPIFAIRS